jgi:hypothetical protein
MKKAEFSTFKTVYEVMKTKILDKEKRWGLLSLAAEIILQTDSMQT